MNMVQEIDKLNNKLHPLEMDHWLHQDLFSFQWWIILSVNVIFFVIFLFFIDRKRTFHIAFAYMVCYFIVCVSDDLGEYFGRWSYPHQLIPFTSQFDAVEFAVVPVTITLIYQTFNSWRMYLLSGMIVSFIYAFVGLPIFVFLNITKLNNWNYFYSFLVLLVTFILVKFIPDSIARMNHPLKQTEHDDRKFAFPLFKSKKKAR
jgi:hypothetical protein